MKKLSKKRRKRSPRGKLKVKCLNLWKKIIKSKEFCERCGKKGIDPHHVIGKDLLILRNDLRNGCLLCKGCHSMSQTSAHKNSVDFNEWFANYRPEDWAYLMENRRVVSPQFDYEPVLEYLKEQKNLLDS